MSISRRFIVTSILFGFAAILMFSPLQKTACLAQGGVQSPKEAGKKASRESAGRKGVDPYTKEVKKKRGNVVVVSRRFSDEVKKNNQIILSKVAVKSRLDKNGQLEAYQLVVIDKGSVVDKIGLKPKDLITSVNGVPVKDLNANREVLEMADHFDITVVRKGKAKKFVIEIQ
ncbi:MAG: hypothetical protein A4E57_01201 [Syntrophorhabdaceae bacterium PtaU1.Bin034]|nr:MAG: hypothetical protein A4E57_01201 [Syntrophorhabdaceae bacterium PtaU1.Bin034]